MESDCCLFVNNNQVSCSGDVCGLKEISKTRLETIKLKSKKRKDTLHETLENLPQPSLKKLKSHSNCISTYTSETHIKRYLSMEGDDSNKRNSSDNSVNLRRRSESARSYIWKEHCLFCGEKCTLEKDKKHPDRWRESYACRTSERGSMMVFKKRLLKVRVF